MSEASEHEDQATIRRAPKISMFLLIGGALGAVVTFILTALFPVNPNVGFGPLFGYFLLYGIPAGMVLGAVVGLILDRRSRRKQTWVAVERESVIEPEPGAGAELDARAEPSTDAEPDADTETDAADPVDLEAEPIAPAPTDPGADAAR